MRKLADAELAGFKRATDHYAALGDIYRVQLSGG
jgi:hypothetical protein